MPERNPGGWRWGWLDQQRLRVNVQAWRKWRVPSATRWAWGHRQPRYHQQWGGKRRGCSWGRLKWRRRGGGGGRGCPWPKGNSGHSVWRMLGGGLRHPLSSLLLRIWVQSIMLVDWDVTLQLFVKTFSGYVANTSGMEVEGACLYQKWIAKQRNQFSLMPGVYKKGQINK